MTMLPWTDTHGRGGYTGYLYSLDFAKAMHGSLIKDQAAGAVIDTCGHELRPISSSTYFPPVLVTNTTADMHVRREQNFGPILPIIAFDDTEQTFEIANETEFGLSAFVYTNNREYQQLSCECLEFSRVLFNTLSAGESRDSLYLPFGGRKKSSRGLHGGKYIFDSYTQLKLIVGYLG